MPSNHFPARAAVPAALGRALRALLVGAGLAGGLPHAASARDAAPIEAANAVMPAQPPVFLEDLTWIELRDRVQAGQNVALLPIGGIEQSGPALTLGKHNARVRALAERIARALGNALIAPVLAYVPEGSIEPPSSHMRYAGTISVPPAVFDGTLEAAARSLRAAGFRDIVLLGDHGGYQAQLAALAERLDRQWSREKPPVAARVWSPAAYYAASSDGLARRLRAAGFRDDEIGTHAGLADSALQLAVAPQTVRQDVLHRGADLDAAHGVYGGNPRGATAELARAGADDIVQATVAAIRDAQAHGREPRRTHTP